MALTPFRWVALAAIGCMLTIVAVVSAVPSSPYPTWYAESRAVIDSTDKRLRDVAGTLNQQAQNMAGRYRLQFLLDSVRRVAARAPDTGTMRVFIGTQFPAETRSSIDKTVRDARGMRPGDAGRLDVFIINDTLHVIRGVRRWGVSVEVRYELPTRTGDRCRVYVIAGEPTYFYGAFTGEKSAQQLLGPCALYKAFGEPGPLVKKWLVDGGWQYSLEGSWTTAPFIPEIGVDSSIFKGPSPAAGYLNVESGAAECLKGALDRCEYALTVSPRMRARQRLPGLTPPFNLGRRRYYAGLIGYQAGEFLSDAVREMGRDRFQRFWTSTDSLPAAYQKATGERWGAFIQRWMIAHYGKIEPGPRMSSYAMVTSAMLVIVAVIATMMMSVRRTYT
jgi:hypothetical protein